MMLAAIVLVFAGGAVLARFARARVAVQRIGIASALSALVLTVIAAARVTWTDAPLVELPLDLGPLGSAPLLAFDGLCAPWAIATAILALVIVLAAPGAMLGRDGVIATLGTAAATEGILLSRNLALLAMLWALALAPAAVRVLRARSIDPSTSRTFKVLAAGTILPMVAAVAVIARIGLAHRLEAPLDLDALATLDLSTGAQALPFALLLASVAVRLGLFPFHSWLPHLMERGPIGVTVLLVGVHTGLFVMARVCLPLLPQASAVAMPWVAGFALVACVWGALLALVQTDLSRTLGFVATSQAGMVMVGLASLESSSLHGALLQSVGIGVALTGALLVVRAIEARCGTRDVRHLGGLVVRAPRASAAFFVLAAATIGFPGSIGFVGEDLLVHGVIEAHPIVASTLLLATALNAITMYRAFARAFLGRPAGRPRTAGPLPIDDFLPRERLATAVLIVLLAGFGLAPAPLIDARAQHVHRLSALTRASREPGPRGVEPRARPLDHAR